MMKVQRQNAKSKIRMCRDEEQEANRKVENDARETQ